MHLRHIELANIRSIKRLVWELPEEQDGAGWHVILGDNGSGKTSLVRAVALCFIGPKESYSLKQPWYKWLRSSETHSLIKLKFHSKEVAVSWFNFSDPLIENGREQPVIAAQPDKELDDGGIWDDKRLQPFYSFGSSRRFSFLTSDEYNYFDKGDASSQHITVFDDSYSLSFGIEYLRRLYIQQLEGNEDAKFHLIKIQQFVNQKGFLPNGVRLDSFSNDGILFNDSNSHKILLGDLSDGYKSVISIVFDLIRNLHSCYGNSIFKTMNENIFIDSSAVVQIDEADLHLHPTWQQKIGFHLTKYFPNVQFIVTTHSPIICQAANTIFVLPTPGTEEEGRLVTGNDFLRLKYGTVLDAYGTGVFGFGIGRSDEAQAKLRRLAELNLAELDRDLTEIESAELAELRAAMPSDAYSLTVK